MQRASGIFLHPTSLPSQFGIGDLGDTAFEWIDMLASSKQSLWQICPLGPTGYGDSPYQTFCSFACNTLLISPIKLQRIGLLTKEEVDSFPQLPDDHVDYGPVIIEKEKLFHLAYSRFIDTKEFLAFCEKERYWLDDYALFRVIKDMHKGQAWNTWESKFKLRFPAALQEVLASERKTIRFQKFLQYIVYTQWLDLKRYANSRGVKIIGDIPIYVAFDSSDTWASPELFELDDSGMPVRVAGVPPDYFSATGQLWGNPLYRWDYMQSDGYSWWIRRLKKILEMVDFVRLDHFRGLESFWAIPASSETAVNGIWEKGPGIDFFNAIRKELGNLPLIAEDLGIITAPVEELRKQSGLPGMKVLQFAFDGQPSNPYLLYNITVDSVTYTGTHDNDTSIGWYNSIPEKDRQRVRDYLGCGDFDFLQRFIRTAFNSPSKFCIIPFQDVLGLDSSARMNSPGKQCCNWQWRYTKKMISVEKLIQIADFTSIYGREPGVLSDPR